MTLPPEAPVTGAIAARVLRGHSAEAWHRASIVVLDGAGAVTHWLGDPDHVTMARSSIKPFQLLPLLRSGAAARFGFADEQLAIMCGSHTGSDAQRALVLRNLVASGHCGADLLCGHHWPLYLKDVEQFPQRGEHRDPLRHNCSGKHSGFLALARHLGVERAAYLHPDSAGQQQVRAAVAELCDREPASLEPAVDGCSAPNYALSLTELARGYLRLLRAEGGDAVHLARIRDAMLHHPARVSGEGRLDLDLCRAFPGRLIAKIGAESLEVLAFRAPLQVAVVKVHDGAFRALGAICVELLEQLGLLPDPAAAPSLARHRRPTVRNDRGLRTGAIEPCFTLQR